ncbi:radical SAM/SPASM domain-containing protein [Dethiosulfatarculus sandiegensis]|uniref:Radical SAM core domain-containing protein n=1 Tax=Dethiosulfatarculus sandiegensis TaxID=1429043 RepID=A0A0D2IZW0_9BACT|nr:radical SAM protein [Dethiosulfatarculus sandiegensis]KIX11499.1 hypothetical protein X474_23500 [Dethiosulfatarculus sandiegensis]
MVRREYNGPDQVQAQVLSRMGSLEKECRRSPLYAWSNGLTELDYFPPILYISPTNACTHRCAICAHKDYMRKGLSETGERQRGLMDWDRFRAICEQIPDDVARIYFYKHGEPLLHPRYLEMVQYLRQKVGDKVEIAISTNATHLRKEMARPLADAFDVILLSTYGLDRQTFASLHGKDDFGKVMANIKDFHDQYAAMPSPRSKVYFNFVRQAGNLHHSDDEVEEFMISKFPYFHNSIHGVYNFGGRISEGNFGIFEQEDKSDFPVCVFPYTIFTVLWDGWVSHCMVDVEEVFHGNGRAPDSSLMDLLNHPGLIDYRRASVQRDFPALWQRRLACEKCNWLFHLRAQSLNYLTLKTKQIAEGFKLTGHEGLELSAAEMLYNGLVKYLEGDMAGAAGGMLLASEVAGEDWIREKAALWEKNLRKVYAQRHALEKWEKAFNNEGITMRHLFKTTYFESSEQGRKKRLDEHNF